MNTNDEIKKLLAKIEALIDENNQLLDATRQAVETDLLAIIDKLSGSTTVTVYHVWSDGACSGNPGPGGWGTIIKEGDKLTELSGSDPKTTNNIMELTGALEGIKFTPEGSSVILTSDSQYLVKGMTEWISGWKKKNWKKADGKPVLNRDIWTALDRESAVRSIEWKWVKGHAGHPRNERCDELARQAINQL